MLWFLVILLVLLMMCHVRCVQHNAVVTSSESTNHKYLTPSDYYLLGAQKPRLEILRPKNGEILDTRDLKIIINIHGFDTQTSYYSSSICVALSTGQEYSEQCFDHTDFTFHANGLLPGTNYGLRIVLFDRGQAIAVSVRNFRVGGIRGVPLHEDEMLTIKTAVQLAVQYQAQGMENQAASIYRRILDENPTYPDALHLLGVVYYQKGDAITAVHYVERALQTTGNFSFDGFHNTLGVCYRTLGRIDEAEEQFRIALSLSPDLLSAQYNLGLIYQQKNILEQAIEVFRNVTNFFKQFPNAIGSDKAIECKVRECDILQTLQRYSEALPCWKEGIALFPNTAVFYHELGDLQAKLGHMEIALSNFRIASNLGRFLSYLNVAYILEQLGYHEDSQATYQAVLQHVQQQHLPSFHIKVRLATLMPRIFSSTKEIRAFRERHLHSFQRLLTGKGAHVNGSFDEEIEIDNTSPLSGGFGIGYHYLFHHSLPSNVLTPPSGSGIERGKSNSLFGLPVLISNKELKVMLFKLYGAMCPSLRQGYFIGLASVGNNYMKDGGFKLSSAVDLTLLPESVLESRADDVLHDTNITASPPPNIEGVKENFNKRHESCGMNNHSAKDKIRIGFVSRYFFHHQVGILSNGLIELLSGKIPYPGLDRIPDYNRLEVHVFFIEGGSATDGKNHKNKGNSGSGMGTSIYHDHLQARIIRNSNHNHFLTNYYYQPSSSSSSPEGEEGIFGGMDAEMNNMEPPGPPLPQGATSGTSNSANQIARKDLTNFVDEIRSANLDILIYPEIGLDPVTYFLAFSRLAKVQMAWLGHPDTTGISTIDYFITSDVELLPVLDPLPSTAINSKLSTIEKIDSDDDPARAWDPVFTHDQTDSFPSYSSPGWNHNYQSVPDSHRLTYYSENNVIAMPHFGTLFLDLYRQRANLQSTSPRTILLNRLKFIESIHIPKASHLYAIPHSTIKLSPDFDLILLTLLQQDKLGYLLIIDLGQAHESWQVQFMERLSETMVREFSGQVLSEDMKERILFPSPVSPADMSGIIQISHVVLEPFPVTGAFDTSLEAIAMGIPVVTWPISPLTAGRMTLALYRILNYGITKHFVPVATEGKANEGNEESFRNSTDSDEGTPSSMYSPLVVHSMDEYVKTALKLTHQQKIREFHSVELLKRRDRLFQGNGTRIVELWTNLFKEALAPHSPLRCKE